MGFGVVKVTLWVVFVEPVDQILSILGSVRLGGCREC